MPHSRRISLLNLFQLSLAEIAPHLRSWTGRTFNLLAMRGILCQPNPRFRQPQEERFVTGVRQTPAPTFLWERARKEPRVWQHALPVGSSSDRGRSGTRIDPTAPTTSGSAAGRLGSNGMRSSSDLEPGASLSVAPLRALFLCSGPYLGFHCGTARGGASNSDSSTSPVVRRTRDRLPPDTFSRRPSGRPLDTRTRARTPSEAGANLGLFLFEASR